MIGEDGAVTCEKCLKRLEVGDHPFCPHGKGLGIPVGDEIDVWIKNGLCHEDGSPKHYTSREQLNKDATEKGFTNYVVHQGGRGTDKSKHTVRWIAAPVQTEEERLKRWYEHEASLNR